MELSKFCETLEKAEKTTSKIEKTKIISKIILEDKRIPYLLNGLIWPQWEGKETGVSVNTLISALQKISRVAVEKEYIKTGDIGAAAAVAVSNLKQKNFFARKHTINTLYTAIENLAATTSHTKKEKILIGLFIDLTPTEAKHVARIITNELRSGIGNATIRDAISLATGINPEKIERAYMITTDWRKVIEHAKNNTINQTKIQVFNPIAPMLAQVSEDIKNDTTGEKIIEWKYDGARVQIHKKGNQVKIYTRRLEDVTNSHPDIVQATKTLPVDEIIFEGEAIAINENGKVLPFQYVLRRFRRKHNVEKIMEKIKIEVRAFDLLYLNGEEYIDKLLTERRKKLEQIFPHDIIKPSHSKTTKTPEEALEFYNQALEAGHEGIMIKDPNSTYEAGKRGKKWLKYKPVMEPLDLIITGAEWGDGKRAGLLAAFEVSVLDEETGEYLPIGRVGTGFTDDDLKELTKELKDDIISQEGKHVKLKPRLIITVAYQEIQKSPKYRSGFALRFPRFIGIRTDKTESDTLKRVRRLFKIYS